MNNLNNDELLALSALIELAELNRMADNVLSASSSNPSESEISRWMSLFSYTRADAEYLLTTQLNDVTRHRIPDSHWELIYSDIEKAGHSRDSYEHMIGMKELVEAQSSVVVDANGKVWTLLRLGGLLRSVERVKEIAGLQGELYCTDAESENGIVKVAWVDQAARARIEGWIEQRLAIQWKRPKKPEKEGPYREYTYHS